MKFNRFSTRLGLSDFSFISLFRLKYQAIFFCKLSLREIGSECHSCTSWIIKLWCPEHRSVRGTSMGKRWRVERRIINWYSEGAESGSWRKWNNFKGTNNVKKGSEGCTDRNGKEKWTKEVMAKVMCGNKCTETSVYLNHTQIHHTQNSFFLTSLWNLRIICHTMWQPTHHISKQPEVCWENPAPIALSPYISNPTK